MTKTRRHSARATLIASTMLAAGSPVFAQAAPAQTVPAPPAPVRPAPGRAIEDQPARSGDIIVTARKRDERLLDVPVAVSALSRETIDRYATNSLTAIGLQVPQLVIGETTNQTGGSINLRGIGAGIANPSTEQAVTLNLDGIPVSYGNAVRLGQIDLQQVEVLKGPQSLFYGKNAPGGIISLISADPGRELEVRLRGGYEFAAEQRFVEAIVSGPITDTVGARVVGYYSKEDGWFRNLARPVPGRTPGAAARSNNAEDVFVRGTLTFTAPDDSLRVKTKVNYGRRDRDGIGPAALGQPIDCPFGTPQVSGALTTDCRLDRNFTDAALSPATAALNPGFRDGRPFADSRQFLASLSADYDLTDTVTLSSVSGFYRLTESSVDSYTSVALPASAASNDFVAKAFSQELRLATDFDGPLNFLVGGFYQDAKLTVRQAFAIDRGVPTLIAFTFFDQRTTAYSVFAQARYAFTEQLELAAGGRRSWERKSLDGTVNATAFEILNPRRKFRDFSPEVTLTWKPDSDLTTFAAYREGFTSGGFNTVPSPLRSAAFPALPARDLSFDQVTAHGGEVGIKGYLLDRQLQFDLVGYNYKYKDLQLSRFDNIGLVQTVQNAAGARVRGIEFSGTLRPRDVRGLELRSAVGFNRARYTEFTGGCYAGQSIAAGCNLNPRNPALPAATNGTTANPFTAQDQSGRQLARAPEWSLASGFTYDRDFNDTLGGSITFDATYTSAYDFQTEAEPRTRQGGYWQLNGSVSLHGGPDRGWELALIGRNLTNRLFTATGATLAFTGIGTGTATTTPADVLGVPGPPRSVMLQLTLRDGLLRR